MTSDAGVRPNEPTDRAEGVTAGRPPNSVLAASRLPLWLGSIRLRLTFVYSSTLFSVVTFLVGVLYMAESRALSAGGGPGYRFSAVDLTTGRQVTIATDQELVRQVHEQTLDVLRQYSLIGIVVMFLLSLVIGWVVSGGVLRPIERITGVAKDIQATDLSRRIDLGGPHDELRELADTFDDMLGRIDQAFESQRQFIHEASHELRNPLAVIRTNLEVMLSDPDADADDLRHTLEVVQRSSDRMTRLVDDLLLYARNGALSVQREQVDVSALVHDSADEFRTPAEAKGVSLIDQTAGDLVVDGDRHALRQALANLLANAVRVSPGGTIIRVRAGAHGPWIWMSVEDEGPGIAAEDQDRVFQRFWRGDTVARGEVRSGLGLTIVRQIAQAHGGDVKLVSEPGRGSAFAIWLPAAPVEGRAPDEGPVADAPSSPTTAGRPVTQAAPTTAPVPTVVVDAPATTADR